MSVGSGIVARGTHAAEYRRRHSLVDRAARTQYREEFLPAAGVSCSRRTLGDDRAQRDQIRSDLLWGSQSAGARVIERMNEIGRWHISCVMQHSSYPRSTYPEAPPPLTDAGRTREIATTEYA